MQGTIKDFKARLSREGMSGLALDIDETLSATNKHWFDQMLEKFGNPENLTTEEVIKKYRYSNHVPYFQTEEAQAWMEKQRRSDSFQEELPLVENSNDIVRKINEIAPIIAYLTARPEEVIGGTKKWLEGHNFPPAEIIGRPTDISHEHGNEWKAKTLQELHPEIIGIIDDNPAIIEFLPKDYQGTIFLYDNTEHDESEIDIIPSKTWEDVLANVRQKFQ